MREKRQEKVIHNLKKSLELCNLLSVMTSDEKKKTVEIIKEADIARLIKNSSIRRELKEVRGQHKGKIKRFLTQLSRHEDAEFGVDVLFEKWSSDVKSSEVTG